MTGESLECFNCGRTNPDWAQVCRSCGVTLRHGIASTGPGGRFPTDSASLVSIGAVVGTILLAVLVGFFLSNLNPTDPTIGVESTPTPSATPATPAPTSAAPEPTVAPTATPQPTPVLPGTVEFGSELDGNQQVVEPVDTFTPGMTFAHSISLSEPFGVNEIGEQVVRILEDGTEEQVVDAASNRLRVDPSATTAGFVAGDAAGFVSAFGPGTYELRVFRDDELIARGEFRLAEG
ncbi:MAG: hypothetical protein ACRDGV_09035 [Candidatus Limnocylindria bacterium]